MMQTLFTGRATDFLRDAAFGLGAEAGPCIFVHVPKTAGTSLRAELATILSPDINIHVDYTDTTRSFSDRIDDAVAQFLAQAGPRGIRFASGHIVGRHVIRMARALPQARFITMLRDPVARVVSDYRHQRSARHPGHAEFRARVPSLADYITLRGESDKAAMHLLPRDVLASRDAEACIAHVTRHFSFVGIQEMYDLSFRTLTALAGRQQAPRLRANVNTDADDAPVVDAAMAQQIRALNPLDHALYTHFAEGLRRAEPALRAALA